MTALTAGNATALSSVSGSNATIIAAGTEALAHAYSDSYSIVYLATIAFGGCAVVAALFTSNMDSEMTDEVARKLQGVAE